MFFRGSVRSFLALTIFFLLWPALFAQDPPAQFQIVIEGTQGTNTEGTPSNPFSGLGISLFAKVVNDPDPVSDSLYHYSGWQASWAGSFCSSNPGAFQLFGTEGRSPTFAHPGVRSGTASVSIQVTVQKPGFAAKTQTQAFSVIPNPGGCDGGTTPPGPDQQGPFQVSFSAGGLATVPLGQTINLQASARDTTDNTLTFRYYVSSVFGVRGTLVGTRTGSGCTNTCSVTLPFNVGGVPRTRHLIVEVSDGTNTSSSNQRSITVVANTTPPPTTDAPSVCQCTGGGQVSVNAGPSMLTVVGGEAISLDGDAAGPAQGGAVVPGSFQWSIVDSDGLSSGLSFTTTNALMTSLLTPDVNSDRDIRLRLQASFGTCSCSDDMDVAVLAEAPPEADLELVSLTESADPVTTGANITYTALVRNNGPAQAQGVNLTFLVPAGSFVSGTGNCALLDSSLTDVACTLGNMANGATASREVTVQAGSGGQVSVTAGVFSTTGVETNVDNNSATETTDVVQVTTDLSISKVANASAISLNGNVVYTITVTNQGPENATGVTVTDVLPSQLSFVSSSTTQGSCSNNGGTVVCPLGDLNNGASAGVTLTAMATQVGEQVVNTASVSANEADSNPANSQGQATVAISDSEADLILSIDSVTPNPVGQDKNVQVVLVVRNDGPDDAPGVQVQSVLPQGLSFLSADTDQGTCVDNAGTIVCSLGLLQEAEITVVTLTLQAVGDSLETLVANVDFGGLDPDEDNNMEEVGVRILGPNFLAIPHTVGTNNFIGLGIVNSIGGSNSLSIEGRDANGNLVNQTDREQEIAALGQDAFLTRDLPASDTLIMRGNQGPFQAFFMIGDNNSHMLDGVGSEPQDDTELFLPRIRQTGSDTTTIYLFNPDFEAVSNVTMRLFNVDGIELESTVFDLQPQGSVLATVEDLFGVTDVEDGYVRVDASLAIRGFELVKVTDNFATMMALPRLITQELVSPHFFIGANQQGTRLRFVNANDQAARITVRAFDNDSELIGENSFDIAPSSVGIEELADLLDIDTSQLDQFTVVQGYLEFELSGGTAGPFLQEANVVPIISYDGINKGTLSSLPIPVEGQIETLYLHVAQNRDIFTGLAALNIGDDPATVTIEAFDRSGNRTALRNRVLDPKARVVGLLNSSLFFTGSFQQIGGYLRITSDQPIVTFALFGGARFLSAIGGQRPLE